MGEEKPNKVKEQKKHIILQIYVIISDMAKEITDLLLSFDSRFKRSYLIVPEITKINFFCYVYISGINTVNH